jgi:hypothetical protein
MDTEAEQMVQGKQTASRSVTVVNGACITQDFRHYSPVPPTHRTPWYVYIPAEKPVEINVNFILKELRNKYLDTAVSCFVWV